MAVSAAAIDKNESAMRAAEQRAVANAQSIAKTIEPYYGPGAKEDFFTLLAGHYNAVKAYLMATVAGDSAGRSEEHTSELQSLMRISYAVFCLKKKKNNTHNTHNK